MNRRDDDAWTAANFRRWQEEAPRSWKDLKRRWRDESCPGHVASAHDAKVCARCGVHIDELRPQDSEGGR